MAMARASAHSRPRVSVKNINKAVCIWACILAQLTGRGDARIRQGLGVDTQAAATKVQSAFEVRGPGSLAWPSVGRGLLEADADAEEPFVVTTPQALHNAVAKGRRNIEIAAHLDLTTLPLQLNTGCPDGCDSSLPDLTLTKSIRGNCRGGPPPDEDLEALTGTPGAVALLPFQEGQCLVMVNEDIFRTMGHRLWLDNLYIRAAHYRTESLREYAFINLASFELLSWPLKYQGRRYITRTTFQGDGAGPAVGVWAKEDTYVENCTFANLGGDGFGDACPDCTGAVVTNEGASVTVVNSTFFDPAAFPGTSYIRAWGGARVRVSGCEFAPAPGLPDKLFYTRENGTIYADDATIEIRSDSGPAVAVLPLSAIPEAAAAGNEPFLERSDPWFLYRRQVLNQTLGRSPATPAPTVPVPLLNISIPPSSEAPESALNLERALDSTDDENDDDSDEDGLSSAAIAAIILGVLLLIFALLVCCMAVFLYRARARNSKQQAGDKVSASSAAHLEAASPRGDGGIVLPWDKPAIPSSPGSAHMPHTPSLHKPRPHSSPSFHPSPAGRGSAWALGSTHTSDSADAAPVQMHPASGVKGGLPVPPPGDVGYSIQDYDGRLIAAIHAQLSSIEPDMVIFQRYQLLGASERLSGGRSVVAFATGKYDRDAYALKFFAKEEAFHAEAALQSGSAVSALVPPIFAMHHPCSPGEQGCVDGHGQPLPPCIVYARGESLTQWLKRATSDIFQAVSVLSHVATRLSEIHAENIVHCDIKPAHILLLPRQNRWTVIDFDKSAPIGEDVAPDCVLDYAAPEVVAAVTAGGSVAAQPSMDAWALGVIAFELLTGSRALDSSKGSKDSVVAQLRGDEELPWEGDRLTEDMRRQLGVLRGAVLGLLQRDPTERASVKDLCTACNDVVSSQTTVDITHG